VAVAPDGGRAYVASYSTGTISVVDLATNEVVATRKDAISPNALAVGPDGTHLYVADNRVDTVLSIPLRG
jgi:YVTN family beta-propeller protein